MNAEDFARACRDVWAMTTRETLALLDAPPGRRPDPDLLEASRWFARLDSHERHALAWVIATTSRDAIFAVLAVIDGVSDAEGLGRDDKFELWVAHPDGSRELVNGPEDAFLHDAFALAVPPSFRSDD